MPTEAELKAMIVLEVNDTSGTIAAQINNIWSLYYSWYAINPMITYNYSLIKAIDILMGKVRDDVTFQSSGNLSASLSHKFEHLQEMRDNASKQIDELFKQLGAAPPPSSGTLTQTAPVMSPGGPDANDRAYRGDPYRKP